METAHMRYLRHRDGQPGLVRPLVPAKEAQYEIALASKKAIDELISGGWVRESEAHTKILLQAGNDAIRDVMRKYGYLALAGELTLTRVADGTLSIGVPRVVFYLELNERLKDEKDLRDKRILQEKIRRKSSANLRRKLGKLTRLHLNKVPPSTRSVWHTFTQGQQLAVLKDIDYAERHKTQRP